MLIYLRLFFEFFCVGLFSIGGGLSTIPFLKDISERTGWFTLDQLANMIAVSESTPGPIGVNMASYVGYEVGGVPGSAIATLGLVAPCIIIIIIVFAVLNKFRDNKYVKGLFYGLRPASTGLIAAAFWSVVCMSLLTITKTDAQFPYSIQVSWAALGIAAVVLILSNYKRTKKLHPIVWIALSAVAGIIFEM